MLEKAKKIEATGINSSSVATVPNLFERQFWRCTQHDVVGRGHRFGTSEVHMRVGAIEGRGRLFAALAADSYP